MTTSLVMEMNLGDQNRGGKQSRGGGRRKSKASDLTQKKNKQSQRGMGVAKLESLRMMAEGNPTQAPPFSQLPGPALPNHQNFFTQSSSSAAFPTSYATVSNGGVQLNQFPATVATTPAMLVQGLGTGCGFHGPNLFPSDHQFQIMDPSGIGSFNVGFRVETSKELSSIPNFIKCASDGCGVCHKKKRITGGSKGFTEEKILYGDIFSMNPFGNFKGKNTNVAEMINAGNKFFAAKTRCCPEQEVDVLALHRKGSMAGVSGGGESLLTEYDFFPERGGGERTTAELMKMSLSLTRKSCWPCSSSTGSDQIQGGGVLEEGSSSVDLTLKL